VTRPEVVIRRLGPADAEAYRTIRLAGLREATYAFASSFEAEAGRPIEHFGERLAATAVFGAFTDGRLVGMAGFRRAGSAKEQHKGELWGIYVDPAARGLSIGAAVVQAALDHARGEVEQVRLAVSHGNAAAIGLYERLGFVAYGREPRALKGPDGYSDDIWMMLMLTEAGS
jgi:ribosomal protein S18 acetylase RimI-like enzyme